MGSLLIAAAALKTPTRNGYNAQGVNLKFSMHSPLKEYIEFPLQSRPPRSLYLSPSAQRVVAFLYQKGQLYQKLLLHFTVALNRLEVTAALNRFRPLCSAFLDN